MYIICTYMHMSNIHTYIHTHQHTHMHQHIYIYVHLYIASCFFTSWLPFSFLPFSLLPPSLPPPPSPHLPPPLIPSRCLILTPTITLSVARSHTLFLTLSLFLLCLFLSFFHCLQQYSITLLFNLNCTIILLSSYIHAHQFFLQN